MKKQKGITLIALIITIIVMLILVGVTINVALSGGLFEKANSASKQTQKEVDKEMLLSAVVATVDSQGNYHLDQVQENLPEGEFTYNSTTKVYKSKNGNEFTINETTGKVEEYVAPTTQPEEQEVIPQAKTYSFTLNQLGTPEEISDSIAEFNCNTVWSISSINEDLSKNKNYALEDGHVFMVESNDPRFQDENDSTPNQEKEYTIFVAIEGDYFCIAIYDLNGEYVITPENYSTFLATDGIGDITFTFKEVS